VTTLSDPVEETRRIIEAASADGLPIRAVGGVGVAMIAPTVARLEPRRTYHDIDLAAPPGTAAITRLMTALGYEAAAAFNTLNGSERLLFHDQDGRRVDIFIDTLRMCHELPFRDRLGFDAWRWTLPPADLLLSKLQIVELTERDAQDVPALLADHGLSEAGGNGIELGRIGEVCGNDWGWWRTVDDNLARLIAGWIEPAGASERAPVGTRSTATERARALRTTLLTCPKSMAWRVRAIVGPRMRWYELPEEVR